MNIKLLKDNWRKYYKRGFITGLVVLCFLCFVDQTLQSTIFFNKITSLGMFILTLSYIFFWRCILWIIQYNNINNYVFSNNL